MHVWERDLRIYCAFKDVYCVKLHYIEISAEQQPSANSASYASRQTSSSSSPERPAVYIPWGASAFNLGSMSARFGLRFTRIGTCRSGFRCRFKRSLGGFIIIIQYKYHLVNLFISICFIHEYYSNVSLPQSVCVEIQIFKRYSLYGPFPFGSTIHNFHFSSLQLIIFLHY